MDNPQHSLDDAQYASDALKPCPTPWCDGSGGQPYVFERRHGLFGVYCPTCGCSTHPYFSTVDKAVAQWNTRAALEAAGVAELRDALQEIADLNGEINPSNYDHDDACYLNRQFCYALNIAIAALNPRQNEEEGE